MSQWMPHFPAALAMDRTYQALDSSAVAVTTASRGGVPVAVSRAASTVVSARSRVACSRPERAAVSVTGRCPHGWRR